GPTFRLLGAYRSTEAPPGHPLPHLLADLARDGLADELSLAPLAPPEARALLADVLGEGKREVGEGGALLNRLLERAGGVPFYLVSCARAVLDARERNAGTGLSADEALPWDAAQSIRQRLALLPTTAAVLVRVAAVAGRQIEPALLEALATWLG